MNPITTASSRGNRQMTSTAEAALPTDDDVAFYRQHGYWVSPPLVAPEVLDVAERGMERLYAHDVDHVLSTDDTAPVPDGRAKTYTHWGWTPEHGNVMRKNDYSTLRVDELAQLSRVRAIAACASRLSGASRLRLWHDQLLYKPVDAEGTAGNVSWHTDRYYWMTCSSQDMLTAWIPLADVRTSDGAMSVVDGSHRWSDEVGVQWERAPFSVIEEVLAAHQAKLVPIVLDRGQVSFHHCKTIHGSGPNLSRSPRRSLVLHFQPEDNHFVEEGHRHPNDDLVRRTPDGRPDYADPAICPVLFP